MNLTEWTMKQQTITAEGKRRQEPGSWRSQFFYQQQGILNDGIFAFLTSHYLSHAYVRAAHRLPNATTAQQWRKVALRATNAPSISLCRAAE